MPGGDGTGPRGMGAMSGRGMGYCTGFGRPGWANPGYRGFGFGRKWGSGFGRGPGRGFGFAWNGAKPYPTFSPAPGSPDPEHEKQLLQDQATALERELQYIKNRLQELDK